jgi:hypothetical protein
VATVTQPSLFDPPPRKKVSPGEKWARWIATERGVELYREIERRVLACANSGDYRIEVNRIVADVRRGPPPEGIDNSIRSYISRELIAGHPFLAEKIEVRPLKGEG